MKRGYKIGAGIACASLATLCTLPHVYAQEEPVFSEGWVEYFQAGSIFSFGSGEADSLATEGETVLSWPSVLMSQEEEEEVGDSPSQDSSGQPQPSSDPSETADETATPTPTATAEPSEQPEPQPTATPVPEPTSPEPTSPQPTQTPQPSDSPQPTRTAQPVESPTSADPHNGGGNNNPQNPENGGENQPDSGNPNQNTDGQQSQGSQFNLNPQEGEQNTNGENGSQQRPSGYSLDNYAAPAREGSVVAGAERDGLESAFSRDRTGGANSIQSSGGWVDDFLNQDERRSADGARDSTGVTGAVTESNGSTVAVSNDLRLLGQSIIAGKTPLILFTLGGVGLIIYLTRQFARDAKKL